MDKLNVLAKLIIKYPEEHSMLLSLAAETKQNTGNIIPYSGEASAQGLNVPQQLGYAASRALLDTNPIAARQVATGKVPLPKAKDVMIEAWNSKIFDWTLSALGAMADAIPGPGTVVSVAIAKGQLVKAAAKPDFLAIAFAALAVYPYIGDALGMVGRAIRDGLKPTTQMAKGIVNAFAKITNSQARKAIISLIGMCYNNLRPEKIAAMADNALAAKDKFVGDLNKIVTTAASAQPVRMG